MFHLRKKVVAMKKFELSRRVSCGINWKEWTLCTVSHFLRLHIAMTYIWYQRGRTKVARLALLLLFQSAVAHCVDTNRMLFVQSSLIAFILSSGKPIFDKIYDMKKTLSNESEWHRNSFRMIN